MIRMSHTARVLKHRGHTLDVARLPIIAAMLNKLNKNKSFNTPKDTTHTKKVHL